MTRIVAGSARGRRLDVPPKGTRPTSDRVREAMFSAIDSLLRAEGRNWQQVRALDLFAGSGALGLEAISRGAQRATLVESGRPAAATLRRNLALVGGETATLVVKDVRLLGPHADEPFDLCFADPPYDWTTDAVVAVLRDVYNWGWLAEGALCVVERSERDKAAPFPPDWQPGRRRAYGDTAVWYGRASVEEGQLK